MFDVKNNIFIYGSADYVDTHGLADFDYLININVPRQHYYGKNDQES